MKDLVTKIKKGREKGISRRYTKFYRKAIRDQRKFIADCKELESAWRWIKASTVILILAFVYAIYSGHKNSRLIGELNTEYKELIEMQIAANESLAQANELIELVKKNKKLDEEIKELDEEIMDLIEQKLDKVKPKPDSAMSQAMSAGLRLLEFMSEAQADDGNIYCPLCNRKI